MKCLDRIICMRAPVTHFMEPVNQTKLEKSYITSTKNGFSPFKKPSGFVVLKKYNLKKENCLGK